MYNWLRGAPYHFGDKRKISNDRKLPVEVFATYRIELYRVFQACTIITVQRSRVVSLRV